MDSMGSSAEESSSTTGHATINHDKGTTTFDPLCLQSQSNKSYNTSSKENSVADGYNRYVNIVVVVLVRDS